MNNNKIILISLSHDELREIIQDAVKQELNLKKERELLSFKETCEFLGCSASALFKWKAENRLPYRKIGKRVMFHREEILAAMKESNYKKFQEIK
ncbi:MAG: helix-turn-helix domain-containing protein [bacterium]|nr:helix-turn-helix domain-containing protein [bacterium]